MHGSAAGTATPKQPKKFSPVSLQGFIEVSICMVSWIGGCAQSGLLPSTFKVKTRQSGIPCTGLGFSPMQTPPHPHQKNFLRQKMKITKGARNLRPILGAQTFFWPLTPPPPLRGLGLLKQ